MTERFKPTFNSQFSFGNIVTLIVFVFGLGAGYVTMQRDVVEISDDLKDVRGEVVDVDNRLTSSIRAIEKNDRNQEIAIARQDERVSLILQGIARLESAVEGLRSQVRE